MAALPYMPLYVADYLSDAAHLSTLEHGAYLLLIMTYWQRGEALPDDDRKLARICRVGPREWSRLRPVLCEFFQVGCNNWSHSRIDRELAAVRDKSLKRRKAGLARAEQMHSGRSANAKLTDTDTDTVPLDKSNGLAPSSEKALWDAGVAYLTPYVKGSARALIGKWSRDYGKPETGKAITAAQIERAVDPVAYIERCLRGATREASFSGPC